MKKVGEEKMGFCSNCGNELPEGMKFCPNCGAAVQIYNPSGVSELDQNNMQPGVSTGSQNADQGSWQPRPTPEQDPMRAMYIPPQQVPEEPATGLGKYGKFIGLGMFILAIVDIVSDPALLTIILSIVIIGGSIFCLANKFKLKGFPIVAIIIAVICLLGSISQAKRYGLLTVPGKSKPVAETSLEESDGETSAQTNDKNSLQAQDNLVGSEADGSAGGVDPDLKAFLDSYEDFVDEYVEFMKKYMANPTDLSLLGEYSDMMSKYTDFATKIDKYDTNTMSTEDAAYYLEVTGRCTQKMLGIL